MCWLGGVYATNSISSISRVAFGHSDLVHSCYSITLSLSRIELISINTIYIVCVCVCVRAMDVWLKERHTTTLATIWYRIGKINFNVLHSCSTSVASTAKRMALLTQSHIHTYHTDSFIHSLKIETRYIRFSTCLNNKLNGSSLRIFQHVDTKNPNWVKWRKKKPWEAARRRTRKIIIAEQWWHRKRHNEHTHTYNNTIQPAMELMFDL